MAIELLSEREQLEAWGYTGACLVYMNTLIISESGRRAVERVSTLGR